MITELPIPITIIIAIALSVALLAWLIVWRTRKMIGKRTTADASRVTLIRLRDQAQSLHHVLSQVTGLEDEASVALQLACDIQDCHIDRWEIVPTKPQKHYEKTDFATAVAIQAAVAALGKLQHSDALTDSQAVEVQDFSLRLRGFVRANRRR